MVFVAFNKGNMDIQNYKIEDIKPYPKNAKKHDNKQIKQVAKSIEEFGFNQPIVVDKKNVIVVGHGRLEAAKLLNLKEVPVLKIDISDKKARAYRLADNKLNESPWDTSLVIEELKDLAALDFDITLTGFDRAIIDLVEDNFDAQAEYDKINIPKAKAGDVYELGRHRLMCGDATKIDDLDKLMAGGGLARLVFTDPPYNVDYHSPGGLDYDSKKYGGSGGRIFNDNLTTENYQTFCEDVLKNIAIHTENDATIYWWFAQKNNHVNRLAFINAGWHMSQIVIWVKNSMVYSRGQDYHRQYEPCMVGWKEGKSHYRNKRVANLKDVFNLEFDDFEQMLDVWYQRRDDTTKYVHPTQKPIRLAERALKRNSEEDDIVLDCFAGSGSTLMACEQTNRICRTMELDPKYVQVVLERWSQFTGKDPIRLNDNKSWQEIKRTEKG